MTTIWMH